jgi:uncharacterized protein
MLDNGVPAFHLMAKPAGSRCNCACEYCFYLAKADLYPGGTLAMPDEVHRAYIEQLFAAHRVPRVTVAWQGGEPTLMGLDFYRRSVDYQAACARPGTLIENTFQTNGLLLDDEWCRFFRENDFLVGLSMDGPKELHDVYRKDRAGLGTFDRVLRAARLLQEHGVEFNILCTVNARNADRPLDVYRFFRDELGAQYIQFIPIVEREGNGVTDRSVRPDQWGRFLIGVFDEWVEHDVGRTFVLNFDGALAGWLGQAGTVCIFGPTCGLGMALEHNGDLYSCDHFVEPAHYLGNILETPLSELVASEKQRTFGRDKRDTLPQACLECGWLGVCNGECPKNRFVEADGETGLNYLCDGYRAFFAHADPAMKVMADLIREGRPADEIMAPGGGEERKGAAKPGRNDPCFCGSGLKFKRCHGKHGSP